MTDEPEFIPTPEERRRNREKARHGALSRNQGTEGAPPPQYPGRQNWWFRRSTKAQFGIVIACAVGLFVLIGVIGAIADKNDGGSGNNSAAPATTSVLEPATAAPDQSESTPPAEPSETPGQQNARESAQSYLETSAFSRSGLIKQLKYEGYSLPDATYAVGAITVNWKEQAAKSARSYLGTSAFSRSGLIRQLKYEGYSLAEATYAVGAISVNWNEQAAKSARSYLETSSFSRSALIQQLEYEGFTPAQATYGANAAY